MQNRKSQIATVLFTVLIAMIAAIPVSAQFGWNQTDPNAEKLIGTAEIPALEEANGRPGVYKPWTGRTIKLGVYAKKVGQWGSIPTNIKLLTVFTETDGLCQGTADEQRQCRETLYFQSLMVVLPAGGYSVSVRPMPNQPQVIQTHLGVQFAAGLPNATVTLSQNMNWAAAEKNLAVVNFSSFDTNDANVGYPLDGRRFWGTGTVNYDNTDTFGFAYGTSPLPVQIHSGQTFNLNPNHNGNYLQPNGFQAPTFWGRVAQQDQGRQVAVTAQMSMAPNTAITMLRLPGAVVR